MPFQYLYISERVMLNCTFRSLVNFYSWKMSPFHDNFVYCIILILIQVWEPLKRNFGRVIAADMLGLGFSDKPVGIAALLGQN